MAILAMLGHGQDARGTKSSAVTNDVGIKKVEGNTTMSNRWISDVTLAICLLLSGLNSFATPRSDHTHPFCSDAGCTETRALLKQTCDYILANKATVPTIYVGGYYMRTLVDGYEILGDRRYLDAALAYSDYLLGKQMANGFWPTGYGAIYLADTGSALGLFIALYKHADAERQKKFLDAVLRYANSIQKNGMIHPSGAFGTGWGHVEGDTMSKPIPDQYTLSSALTGGEIFTWIYHVTGKNEYRETAYQALRWVLSTMRDDGNIPYILAEEGADWDKHGDAKNDYELWEDMTYGTAGYVGEGILAFDLHCDQPEWRGWIEKAVQPNIEFLLKNQLADGTWSKLPPTSWDRTRWPGVIDYLIWYYEHVNGDPRVAQAVQKFDAFVLDPEKGKSLGLLNRGAVGGVKANSFNTVTSLTGRALAEILSPGVDSQW
jgi:hypothetical protein